jgi:hypothetical protein
MWVAMIAIAVGSSLVNYLIRPRTHQEITGPRIDDLLTQASTYDADISIVFATTRLAGNVIYAQNLLETKHVDSQEVGGSGGGDTITNTTYTYSATFAVAFAKGPAEKVLRIWADGKLIWDPTTKVVDRTPAWNFNNGNHPGSYVPADQPDYPPGAFSQVVSTWDVNFQFYKGDEVQDANPIMVADKGAAATPAYRGLCYIMFDALPLANFGNRIPNITAEIAFTSVDKFPMTIIKPPNALNEMWSVGISSKPPYYYLQVQDKIFTYSRDTNLPQYVPDIDATSGNIGSVNGGQNWMLVDDDGFCYMQDHQQNYSHLIKVDPVTGKELARSVDEFGANTGDGTFGGIPFVGIPGKYAFLQTVNEVQYLIGIGASFGGETSLSRTSDMYYMSIVNFSSSGGVFAFLTDAFIMYQVSTDKKIRYRQAATTGGYSAVQYTETVVSPIEFTDDPLWGIYDKSSGAILIGMDNGQIIKYDLATDTVIGVSATGVCNSDRVFSVLDDGTIITGLKRVRVSDLTVVADYSGFALTGASYNGEWVYDKATNSIVGYWPDQGLVRLYLDRAGAGDERLDQVVAKLCKETKLLVDADFDVSALEPYWVHGSIVAKKTTARSAIENLAAVYAFDACESDHIIKFVPKVGTPVFTVPDGDLVDVSDDQDSQVLLKEANTEETDIPIEQIVVYQNYERDYQDGSQPAKRPIAPTPVASSRTSDTFTSPVVLSSVEASQLAEMMLYRKWLEARGFEGKYLPKWLKLDPTDIGYFGTDLIRARLIKCNIGYDISFSAVCDDDGFDESAGVSSDASFDSNPLSQAFAANLGIFDIPLIRDVDANDASVALYYVFGSNSQFWPGGVLEKSPDNVEYSTIGGNTISSNWGQVLFTLAAPRANWAWDEVNTLTIRLQYGSLTSAGITAVLNGENAAIVGTELIQFRTVTDNLDGTFTLSGLLRGRRGTELSEVHLPGESFFLIDTSSFKKINFPTSEIGKTSYYKGPNVGTSDASLSPVKKLMAGNSLKPYAPCNFAGYKDSDGQWTIHWQRRTRKNGDWLNGIGTVPLGEDSELYDLEICTLGGVVKRTITKTKHKWCDYTVEQQTIDFGSVQDSFLVNVYQISAVVGRGFKGSAIIDVFGNYGVEPSKADEIFEVNGQGPIDPDAITVASLDENNTAAFSPYNKANFSKNFLGIADTSQDGDQISVDSTKMDDSSNPVMPARVSDEPVAKMHPLNPSVKDYAHYVPFKGNAEFGQNCNTIEDVHKTVDDMIRRQYKGIIIDWYGEGTFSDQVALKIQADISVRTPGTFEMIIQADQGIANLTQSVLIDQITYLQSQYFGETYYATRSSKPILQFFNIRSRLSSAEMIAAKAATTGSTAFWMDEGLAHVAEAWVDGTFEWAHDYHHNEWTGADPHNLTDTLAYITGAIASGKPYMAASCPGFNGTTTRSAAWSDGKYLPRDNGACYIDIAATVDANIDSNCMGIQTVTWNDMKEGSNVIQGIDNYLTISASISTHFLNWSASGGTGDESTIDHYAIYRTEDDIVLTLIGSKATGVGTLDLSTGILVSGTTYKLYVVAVGIPNVRNKHSAGVAYTA